MSEQERRSRERLLVALRQIGNAAVDDPVAFARMAIADDATQIIGGPDASDTPSTEAKRDVAILLSQERWDWVSRHLPHTDPGDDARAALRENAQPVPEAQPIEQLVEALERAFAILNDPDARHARARTRARTILRPFLSSSPPTEESG